MIKTLQNTLKQDREGFALPKSVQDAIPIRRLWPDGIFQFGSKFSKTIRFSDINYAIASKEDKMSMFLGYSELLNGNGFVLGVSGSGKSFTAKREMVNLALSTDDDIIVIGRESEYRPLIEGLGGEVISSSATSPNHVNAMDMEQGYGDGESPVVLKSEFLLSLCEQLMDGRLLSAKGKSIIDRCTASVYHSYIKGFFGAPPEPSVAVPVGKGGARECAQFSPQAETKLNGLCDDAGKAPTLQDFHAELLQSHTARTMLVNSEFLVMLSQAATDRAELARLLNISDNQLSYITNVDFGRGLIKCGSAIVPFMDNFPKNRLYRLMTTRLSEQAK